MHGDEWWFEVEAKGHCPEEGQEEEWIRERVRDGEGWAIAYWAIEDSRSYSEEEW